MCEDHRILSCSDIHGHVQAFRNVLRDAAWRPGSDALILLGDYVDRGPSPRAVVSELRVLLRCPGVVALRGNHEQMLADYLRGSISAARYLANGGGTTLDDYRHAPGDLARDAAFLEGLPTYHETEEYVFVHGGLLPGVAPEEQSERDLLWIREDFIAGYRGKTVVFGHTPTLNIDGSTEVYVGQDKIGIDTGVAYGGYLSLVEIPPGRIYRSRGDAMD